MVRFVTREVYGGAIGGGIEWCLILSRKVEKYPSTIRSPLFRASKLTGETIVWKREHLLEIRYASALIEQFRNVWALSEDQHSWSPPEHEYYVEIRLPPSSPDFSALTPTGEWR
jgi:hypothetical protein